MWPLRDKNEVRFIKVAESINIDQKGESIFEFGVPIGENVDNKGLVRSRHKDKSGNIFEFESVIDLKNEKIIKSKGKRVYIGPLSKRLKSKASVILISLIIGIGFTFLFKINIFVFILGIFSAQILEEIYFKRVNKKYENREVVKTDKIELIKRI